MIQSYKKNPQLSSSYDAIIIGSGMGGLATAAILSKEGKKVLVLERHYTAGGFTHIFKRKGFEWDVGIHYIGEVQRKNSAVRKLFDYVTDSKLKWEDMGDVYDKIVIGEKYFDFAKGTKNFKANLYKQFPEEKEAIDSYIDLVFLSVKRGLKFYMSKAIPKWMASLFASKMQKPFLEFSDRTTYDVISSLTKNEELIKVLTGQYGDYGLPPKQSSFAMHASVVRHYLSGGSFPIGGSSQIAKFCDKVIEKSGGTTIINAEVSKILIKKNKAYGVELTDGKQIFAKHIVSGAGIMTTYQKLLPKQVLQKHNLLSQLKKVKRSVAHACLYIGLEGSPKDLKLPKTNYWIYPKDTDHDTSVERYLNDINEEFPVVYISFPSAKDPDWSNRYQGKSTIDIITLLPYEIFEKWEGSKWMKRGEDYESLKEKIAQRLLAHLYEQMPQVKGKVSNYELSTPLTTQHFVNYKKGEIYGLDHSPSRFRQKFLQPRTPIKNFYLTGQDIVTAGVAGALFSSVLTTSAMLGKNMMKKVMRS